MQILLIMLTIELSNIHLGDTSLIYFSDYLNIRLTL